jgi:hypothetical protein
MSVTIQTPGGKRLKIGFDSSPFLGSLFFERAISVN